MVSRRLFANLVGLITFWQLYSLANAQDDDTAVAGEGRVVGGEYAQPHEFPWMAFLQIRFPIAGIKKCGGTLIDNQWILTAAHCVKFRDSKTKQVETATTIVVNLGRHDLGMEDEDGAQNQTSSEIIANSNFTHDVFDYDVALIKMRSPVRLSPEVGLLALPSSAVCANSFYDASSTVVDGCGSTTAAGWGITEEGYSSKVLKKVNLDVRANSACANGMLMSRNFSEAKICAGGLDGQDTCSGDSGGPLFCKDETGRFMQIGIVSYGDPECSTNIGTPGVYARVCKVLPWIRSYVPLLVNMGCASASLPTITNGAVQQRGSVAVGATRSITCNSNFTLVGDSNIMCRPNGLWTQPHTECKQLIAVQQSLAAAPINSSPIIPVTVAATSKTPQEVDPWKCSIPVVNNGYIVRRSGTSTLTSGSSVDIDTTVVLKCNTGFSILGGTKTEESYTCRGENKWSGQFQPFRCQEASTTSTIAATSKAAATTSTTTATTASTTTTKTSITPCAVPSVDNGNYVSNGEPMIDTSVSPGTSITLSCSEGFRKSPDNIQASQCMDSGEWQPELTGSCIQKTCDSDPADLPNGHVESGDSTIGITRNVVCEAGYRIQGRNYVKCQQNGVWSDPGECIKPMTPTRAPATTIRSTSSRAASTRTTVMITIGRMASATESTIESVMCRVPVGSNGVSFLSPGIAAYSGKKVPSGTTLTPGCVPNYKLQRANARQYICTESGDWEPEIVVTCLPQQNVGSPPTRQGGSGCGEPNVANARVSEGSNNVGSTRVVVCNNGFLNSVTRIGVTPIDCQADGTWSVLGSCVSVGGQTCRGFACPNGKCLASDGRCDGRNDCGDGSDEINCSGGPAMACDRQRQFQCRNGRCILRTGMCDGSNDCGDNSDETLGCGQPATTTRANRPGNVGGRSACDPTEFQCRNGRCIATRYQCDDDDDCGDNSDERNCPDDR